MTHPLTRFIAPGRVARIVGLCALVSGIASVDQIHAQEASEGLFIVVADETGRSVPVDTSALMTRAQELGALRVIVGFDTGFAPEATLGETAATNQRAGIAAAQAQVLSRVKSASGVRQFKTVPYMALTVSPEDLSQVMKTPGVTSIQEDVAVPPSLSESVPLTDAKKLWRKGHRGDGAVVAILDTGTRLDHVAFRDPDGRKIIASACFSSNTFTSTSVCPNGQEEQVNNRNGRAAPNCDSSIRGCDHGTHVAAIAAGYQSGNHGIAHRAEILSVQVFSALFDQFTCGSIGPCARTWTSDQIAGLEQVLIWKRQGINIAAANMSLGGGLRDAPCDTDPRKAIIDNLKAAGVVTVIASGNNTSDGSVLAPGCISSAVTVGSTTKADVVSGFSNHDLMVDLLAPGSSIDAASAEGTKRALVTFNGTSMATPHVAGAFAMLKAAVPGATPDQIERALKCTGVQITDVDTPKPRISVKRAYNFLKKPHRQKSFDFTTATQLRNWNSILGNWVRNGNSMRVVADRNHTWYLTQAPFCADDIRVTVDMKRTHPDASARWSGIIMSSNASPDGKFTGIAFFYSVLPSGQNRAAVVPFESFDGAGFTFLDPTNFLCNTNFNGKAREQRRLLVAEKRGNSIVFKIDGQTVCTVQTDARFNDGHAGIIMEAAPNTIGHRLEVFDVRLLALPQ